MTGKFARQSSGFKGRNHEREKILLVAASGAAVALVVVFILIYNFSADSVDASVDQANGQQAITPAAVGTVALLAPDESVKTGTRLSEVTFKEVYWPRNQVPEGAIRDLSEIQNQYAKSDLSPNVPLQRVHLTSQPSVQVLPLMAGMRAVSIEVDETSGLEGHALPGTRVDVVLTSSGSDGVTSNIIVQNARVLSYGGDTSTLMGGPPPYLAGRPIKMSRTMTLEVSTADALKIQTGRQMGRLSLIMRANDDVANAAVTSIRSPEVQNTKPNVAKAAPAQPSCVRGKMKLGGKMYVIGCDGSMNPLPGQDEAVAADGSGEAPAQ